jgi:NitT/TauT family transport system substrate-binding protein
MNRRAALRTLAAGCLAPLPASAAETALTVSGTPVDSGAEPYYAYETGFFKAAGFDVTLVPSPNGAAIAAAVASGAVDVGNSNIVSLAQAHQRNIPFVIIAPGGLYSSRTPSAILMVPNGSHLGAARDFDGKTIAVNTLRALPQYGTQAWLDKNGAQSASVRFIEMTSPDILVALSQSRVDAAVLVEPFVTPAKAVARPIAAIFDAIAPSFMITAHYTTRVWADAHPDVVSRFAAVIQKTAAWANQNHDRSGAILMKYAQLKEETLRTMLRTVFADRLDPKLIQPVIDLTARYGNLATFPAEELIYRRSS